MNDQQEQQSAAITPREDTGRSELTVARMTHGGLMPRTFDELWRLSRIMAASGMMPAGLGKVEQVFVAVQLGLEVGLSPMQAVQNIAVINGRPSIWGDAALALVRASGLCASLREDEMRDAKSGEATGYRCTAQRTGEPEPTVHEFTVADAKRAGLWDDPKRLPWKQYPQRMLQMRARSWVLRDAFPDVLKGLHIREEVEDIPTTIDTPAAVVDEKTSQLKDRLSALKAASAEMATEVVQPAETAEASVPEQVASPKPKSGGLFEHE